MAMNRSERTRLLRFRSQIVADVDVRAVFDVLLQNNVLDNDLKDIIEAERTCSDRARKLLDLLPTRGADAFKHFVDALREDYEWIADDLENEKDVEDCGKNIYDANSPEMMLTTLLMKGGVPYEPSHHIQRSKVISEVKEGLTRLQPGQFLVMHGMPGSGKSVLAAEAIKDPEITLRYFPDGVFWFRVGMLELDKLFNRMKILCEKLDAPAVPSSIEHAQEILRKLFLSDRYGKCLLILDDVWSTTIIQAFSVCGRVLVTTQDVSIMDGVSANQHMVVAVHTGFTEEESMQLFSSFVGVPSEYLPEEARLIHTECKGSPMVISMIGALISETGRHSQVQRGAGRWTYYYNNLKSRKYSKLKRTRSYQHSSVIEAVGMSIENMDDNLKRLYRQLAVFLDDVGVPTKVGRLEGSLQRARRLRTTKGVRFGGLYSLETSTDFHRVSYQGPLLLPFQVLMTYWGKNRYEVEDIMTEFLKKCLAASEYDAQLQSYVYSLHDLHLDYLKAQLRKDVDNERELHRHFLEQYLRKCRDASGRLDFGRLEDDSYIYSNLGYHMYKSGQLDLFPVVYLDLGFVASMLKACGPVDLLNDYNKFEELIIGMNDEHLLELEHFESFARTIGALVSTQPHTDVVQLALMEPEDSCVYAQARRLSRDVYSDRLFLDWRNRSATANLHKATILHHGAVQTACFLQDMTKIITSNGDGQIKLWDVSSGDVLYRFSGHTASVTTLALAPDGDQFVSGDEDGVVKMWDLSAFVNDTQDADVELQHEALRKNSVRSRQQKSSSVRKQTVSSLLTSDHAVRDLSNASFRLHETHAEMVRCVHFCPDGTEIVVAGDQGTVRVVNVRARCVRLSLAGHREAVNACSFSPDGSVIVTASNDSTVRLWNADSGIFMASNNLHALRVINAKFVNTSNKVVSMSADRLIMWTSPLSKSKAALSDSMVEFKRPRASDFNCMALSFDGRRLVAATADNMLTVWDTNSAAVIAVMPGHTDHIYALDLTYDDAFLLSGSADETVMIWALEELAAKSPRKALVLGPVFDVKFLDDGTSRLAAPDDHNCLQILRDGRVEYPSPPDTSRITCVALAAADVETVAFGCASGAVRIFRPRVGLVKTMGQHEDAVNAVAVADDGATVVSASTDGNVMIFHDGGCVFTCRSSTSSSSSMVSVVLLSGVDSPTCLSRSASGALSVWAVNTGDLLREYVPATHTHVTCMDVNETAHLVGMATTEANVHIVSLINLDFVRLLQGVTDCGPIRACKFANDAKTMAVGYDKGDVQLLDVRTGVRVQSLPRVHSSWVKAIRFSADGLCLVTAGDRVAWWSLGPHHAANDPARKNAVVAPNANRKRSGLFSRRPRLDSSGKIDDPEADHSSQTSLATASPSPSPSPRPLSRAWSSLSVKSPCAPAVSTHLLQTFDVRASSVADVFVDADLSKAVTVDDAGIVYVLEQVKEVRFHFEE